MQTLTTETPYDVLVTLDDALDAIRHEAAAGNLAEALRLAWYAIEYAIHFGLSLTARLLTLEAERIQSL